MMRRQAWPKATRLGPSPKPCSTVARRRAEQRPGHHPGGHVLQLDAAAVGAAVPHHAAAGALHAALRQSEVRAHVGDSSL